MRQVEAFRAVMMSGGITAAATMLNISQPSVSRLIADMERAVGFRLFDRRGARVHPTAQAHPTRPTKKAHPSPNAHANDKARTATAD